MLTTLDDVLRERMEQEYRQLEHHARQAMFLLEKVDRHTSDTLSDKCRHELRRVARRLREALNG